MVLTLTYEEREFLVQTLKDYLAELRIEISRTDNRKFKALLKGRGEIGQALIEKLDRVR